MEYGVDEKNIRNIRGENLLYEFVKNFGEKGDSDAAEIVEILINSGISVNNFYNRGRETALSCAVRS